MSLGSQVMPGQGVRGVVRGSVPIPPGSPDFCGRQREKEYIRSNLRKSSLLIVGGRRIGKTSLLHQVLDWTRGEEDLEPFYVELLGVRDRAGFADALRAGLRDSRNELSMECAGASLASVIRGIRSRDRLPVFLFNEIDGLANHRILEEWRELDTANQARFVMVGYTVVAELGVGDDSLSFAIGSSFGGRAIAPTVLSWEESIHLLDRLIGDDSRLTWSHSEERVEAFQCLFERSYGIPWALQFLCRELAQLLDEQGRTVAYLSDLNAVIARRGDEVLLSIENFDYRALSAELSEETELAYKLILYSMAREKYFLVSPGQPISALVQSRDTSGPGLTFAASETERVVNKVVATLLNGNKLRKARRCLRNLDYRRALHLLTLTLALEVDPEAAGHFGFMMHLFPTEIQRVYGYELSRIDELIRRLFE